MLEVVLVAAAFLGLVWILTPSRPAERRAEVKHARPSALHLFMKSTRPR
ncbi:MAG: hypothetical protein IRZ33_08995 [Alicyclobacillaceae bacterium]|nr:hypothetical protein [Alicyclobacillaceae bacterium]